MDLNGQIADDLDAFFDTEAGFGVAATIGGETVNGIFDDEYAETLDIAGTAPVIACKTEEVADVDEGDTVTIAGTDYTVRDIEQDGTGVTRLVLEKTE